LKSTVPIMDLSDNINTKYIVTEGPQEFRIVPYPATSYSQRNMNWAIIPPSPTSIISRFIRVAVPLTFTISGTNNTSGPNAVPSYVVNTLYSGLCSYPIHKMLSTLTITINNQAVTIRPSQIIDKLEWYNTWKELRRGAMSTTCSYPDQSVYYKDMYAFVAGEFSSYGDQVDHISRMTLPITWTANPSLTPGGSGTATFTVTPIEPLIINPLIFDEEWWRKPGLCQITQFTVNATIDPQGLSRLWKQANNDPVQYTSVSVVIGQPILYIAYMTLPPHMSIPPSISFPFTAVQNFTYPGQASISTNGNYTITSNTLQFQSIPHKILISVSKLYNQKTRYDTDSFLPITSINIT
jgi:hypothetical protein